MTGLRDGLQHITDWPELKKLTVFHFIYFLLSELRGWHLVTNSFDLSIQQMYFPIYLNVSEHDSELIKSGAGKREANSAAKILAAKTGATEIKMQHISILFSLFFKQNIT